MNTKVMNYDGGIAAYPLRLIRPQRRRTANDLARHKSLSGSGTGDGQLPLTDALRVFRRDDDRYVGLEPPALNRFNA